MQLGYFFISGAHETCYVVRITDKNKAYKTAFREQKRSLEMQSSVWNGALCQCSGDGAKKIKICGYQAKATKKWQKLQELIKQTYTTTQKLAGEVRRSVGQGV